MSIPNLGTSAGVSTGGPGLHFILTLHGIRTFGQWQYRLENLVKEPDDGVQFKHFSYGVFSLISYFFPFLRWILVRRFRRRLRDLAARNPGARIDVVAHSFGTYIAGRAIDGLSDDPAVRIHTVILAASVLKVSFPWDDLKAKGVVRRVVNECGTEDNVLLVTQLFILLTGMAGRIGFTGMQDKEFQNRFYKFGHSGYFEPWPTAIPDAQAIDPPIDPIDSFMWRQWRPLLLGDGPVARHDKRLATRLTPLEHFLLGSADPIKLTAYGVILAVFVGLPVNWYTRMKDEATEAHRSLESYASATSKALQAFGRVVREDPELQNRPALVRTKEKILESARGLFRDLVDRASKVGKISPDVDMDLAEAYIEMSRIAVDLEKDPEEVIADYGSAIERLESQRAMFRDAPRILWALGRAHLGRGEQHITLQRRTRVRGEEAPNDLARAREFLSSLLTMAGAEQTAASTPQPVVAIVGLPPRIPAEECCVALATTLMLLGNLETDPTAASRLYEEAEKYVGRESSPSGWINISEGERQLNEGRHCDAETNFIEARDIFMALRKQFPVPIRAHEESLGWALLGLGKAIARQSQTGDPTRSPRIAEALKHMREARDLFAGLDRDFIDNPRHRVALACACKDLGEAIRALTPQGHEEGRKEAVDCLGRAVALYGGLPESHRRSFNVDVPWSWAEHSLGWVLKDLGKIKDDKEAAAEEFFAGAIEHFKKATQLQPDEIEFKLGCGFSLIAHGDCLKKRQAPSSARDDYKKAEALFRALQANPSGSPRAQIIQEGLELSQKALTLVPPSSP